MKAKMVKHHYLRNKWAPIITECKSSGMTVRSWCQINDVNEKQFYYWQRRLREELYTASLETQKLDITPTFIPVPNEIFSNPEPYKTPSAELILTYGDVKMEITSKASPIFLAELLKALHHADKC